MEHNIWIYILVMAAVTYLIRVTPLILIRSEIKNQTVRSFLYYVPYVTLAVMTVPAIIDATNSPIAGGAALVVGIILAAFGKSMFTVAVVCPVVVILIEFILTKL
ncbi:MAG: AzlD domain-containing protein [Clostridia bacterium]|nr:AzlD domain-containing protein [Clostridia bacterium]